MKLNLTGANLGKDDLGYAGQNDPRIAQSTDEAVMYVFKPYANQFQDVGLRPFNYRFDTNFLNDVQEITDQARSGVGSQSALLGGLNTHTNLNDFIMPTPSANLTFHASKLSHYHRFILMLTDSAKGLHLPNTAFSTGGNNHKRRIYTGYFLDEPYSQANFGGQRHPNPNATMVITHKTIVGTQTTMDRLGPQTKLITHSTDEIFNPTAGKALTSVNMGGFNSKIHLMTPDECLNTVDSTEEGDTVIIPGAMTTMDKWKGSNVVSSIMEQPAQNVGHVIKGMIRYQDEMTNHSLMLGRRSAASFDDAYVDENLHRMKMMSHLKLPRAGYNSQFDLDVDSVISIADIDNMVNQRLNIVEIDNRRPMYYETADQFETGTLNQYSFLIASVIAPILSGIGLNELRFTYEIAKIQGQIDGGWRIDGAAASWPVSDQELHRMVRAAQYELEHGIFRTIFESKGDFGVAVSANATGMTSVRLALVEQGMNNPVDFEFPSCMGGLVSPLLGDAASRMQNSEAIESLYQIATGSRGTPPSYFNDDDLRFNNHVNELMSPDIVFD